jgi:DNA-binding NtrC family response regulator
MADKRLIIIGPPCLQAWASPGWTVASAASLRDAAQLLRRQPYPLGLLDLDAAPAPAEVALFLREHPAMQWVGVLSHAQLGSPQWRELVCDYLADFHTRPIDPLRLAHTLGHAHGLAALRGMPPLPAAAGRRDLLAGRSQAMLTLKAQIAKVAAVDAPVLLWGESGSGKELAAQAIHASSPRAGAPFVPVNCGAIPPALIQSELFGYARGAFTGAARDKAGLIETAAGGTLFLDEIADLPKDLQSNLLRFLQEKTIYRVGATRSIEVDARIIAASHVNLQQAVAAGSFREDLFYRLNVLPLTVPPLRQRKDDLPLLAEHFFRQFASDRAARLQGFSAAALRAIALHDWPGNVRELLNRIRRAMVMADGRLISPADLGLGDIGDAMPGASRTGAGAGIDAAAGASVAAPAGTGTGANAVAGSIASGQPGPGGESLAQSRLRAERIAIGHCLERNARNVSRAARELGVSRMTLYRLLDKHGIASALAQQCDTLPAPGTTV